MSHSQLPTQTQSTQTRSHQDEQNRVTQSFNQKPTMMKLLPTQQPVSPLNTPTLNSLPVSAPVPPFTNDMLFHYFHQQQNQQLHDFHSMTLLKQQQQNAENMMMIMMKRN